jgi:hypothetical protein
MLLALAPIFTLIVACSAPVPADLTGDDDQTAADPTEPAAPAAAPTAKPPTAPGAPTTPAAACPYTGPPLDISGFPACRDGGRCIPKSMIPPANLAQVKEQLAECPGGFCAPEKMVKTQNMGLPTSCTSVGGIEGRCTSTVILQVDAQKENIPQDKCDANERCTPCFDPLTNAETGACRQVSCDAPKATPQPLAQCCATGGKNLGRCLPKASLPPAAASGLAQKECPSATDVCIPAEEMTAGFVHPKCKGSSLLGAYDGVCISNCVKKDFLTSVGTSRGNCSAESFCAPCKNPLTGAATGAPNCAP